MQFWLVDFESKPYAVYMFWHFSSFPEDESEKWGKKKKESFFLIR